MRTTLTAAEWAQYEQDGYLRLGQMLAPDKLQALQARIDAIMLGTADIDYSQIMMQLDRIPGETDGPGPQTKGHKQATLRYRKIENLERDPLFFDYMKHPLVKEICQRVYGQTAGVACYRAMFMNKPAREGTHLVWHQDRWSNLDRDPLITIWTALDPATKANGCVQVIPGLHRKLINPEHGSGFLTEEQTQELLSQHEPVYMELAAGEAMLLHNHLPHSSDVNKTDIARRAFSVCYMDAATVAYNGETFPLVF